MIALALSPVIDRYGLHDVSFLFREGPRNLPAHMWLTSFTGVPDIADGSFTSVVWEKISQRDKRLSAPVAHRWEQITE